MNQRSDESSGNLDRQERLQEQLLECIIFPQSNIAQVEEVAEGIVTQLESSQHIQMLRSTE
jgi:hypothetical protein